MSRQSDDEHLRLLEIFHYVYAGLVAVFSFCPSIYIFIGIMFINGAGQMKNQGGGPPPPPELGWVFVGMGTFMIVLLWTVALLVFLAARKIAARKSRVFCIVVAVIEALNVPIGTALGVFTLIVLLRDSVTAQFEGRPALDDEDDFRRRGDSDRPFERPDPPKPPSEGVQEL